MYIYIGFTRLTCFSLPCYQVEQITRPTIGVECCPVAGIPTPSESLDPLVNELSLS